MFGRRKTILERARDKPRLQKSNKYIQAQLRRAPNIHFAVVQVGPLCNRACSHCYSDFGPHRKDSLEMEVVEALSSPENDYIQSVCLTDGEPFLNKNKPVLSRLAQSFGREQSANVMGEIYSRELNIITNGAFARNMKETKEWFLYMKDNGWDLESGNHILSVSCGPTYDVALSNYSNIVGATEDIFGLTTETKLGFSFLGYRDEKEIDLIKKIEAQIRRDIGKPMDFGMFHGNHTVKFFKKTRSSDDHIKLPLAYNLCCPEGRGSSLNLGYDVGSFDNIKDMPFSVDVSSPPMTISYNGEISFGGSQRCVAPGKVYGNIKDIPLIEAANKMIHDPVFSAQNLGGIRFLSYLAQQVKPSFSASGKIVCNTCQEIFSDSGLVDKIRDSLGDRDRTVQSYRKYLDEIGLPKKFPKI
jgi:hypothetical protein